MIRQIRKKIKKGKNIEKVYIIELIREYKKIKFILYIALFEKLNTIFCKSYVIMHIVER